MSEPTPMAAGAATPGPHERKFRGGTPKLNTALSKSMLAFPESLGKDKKNHHGAYLSLSCILDATRKPLAEQGLTLVQTMRNDVMETRLLHESGEEIASEVPIPSPKGPFNDVRTAAGAWQAWGTCKSYARRYEAQAVLSLAGGDEDLDDKDHSATDAKQPARTQQARPQTAKPAPEKPAAAQPSASEKSIEDKADETAKKAAHTARKAADACDTPGKLSSMAQRYKNRTLGERKAIHESALARGWQWDKEKKSYYGGDPDPEITVDELHPVDKDGNPVF